VVVIAVDRTTFERQRLDQAIDAYKAMFQQRSVGRIISERCGSFD